MSYDNVFYVLCMSLLIYRKSGSCTHVSALLHALSSLNIKHSVAPSTGDDYSSEDELPCPSRPCEWKKPKQKKESTLMIDKAEFVKHDYAKPMKKKVSS